MQLEDHFKQIKTKTFKKCEVLKEWNIQNYTIILFLKEEIEGYKIKQNEIDENEVFWYIKFKINKKLKV